MVGKADLLEDRQLVSAEPREQTSMKISRLKLRDVLRTSLWFIPGLMTLGSIACSILLLWVDKALEPSFFKRAGWIFHGGPQGAREVLSTIAGSMITVAGVTFSITIVALSLASQQFGPRLLRHFMGDRTTQLVLGTFIATYLYCLLILQSVRGTDGVEEFVPFLSVTFGLVLAVASLGVLIYFIHHVAQSIQASSNIANVAGELEHTIDRLYPDTLGMGSSEPGRELPTRDLPTRDLPRFELEGRPLLASDSGYLQVLDDEAMMALARNCDVVVRLEVRPGDFVIAGSVLATVWPAGYADRLEERLNELISLGRIRTPVQDAEFSILQVVEIAVRALSPGINDPFTAVNCIDHLGVVLCKLAGRRFPSPYRYDGGKLRVIASGRCFEEFVDAAFDQIRQATGSHVAVALRLLDALAAVAKCSRTEAQRQVLRKHAELVRQCLERNLLEPAYEKALTARLEAAKHATGAGALRCREA